MPASSSIAPPSFSTAEVARRLGVSIPTVQRWVDLGYLKAWKTVGGHRRIDAASLKNFSASREQPLRDEELPKPTKAADEMTTPATGLNVVVVDDNPDDRDVLSALVEEALPGAVLSLAENGFDALLLIGKIAPQVVITDVVMPHMDGVQMLRQLSVAPQHRPAVILAVSSRSAQQVAKLGELPQDVRLITKPIEPLHFIQTLQSALADAGLGVAPSTRGPAFLADET
ncbi:response regulator [Caldimonas brevitalea]|uniref:Sensory box histidine kinase/response regulator n=1 Tax=Caldimonas brevitalea TaxID=413882 RepID=A0A0G3BCK2_9BURK|nr:response regulator [Caldimonas brevitalea]AKJ27099.1 sensory box histidine kinase/response regulator [Caldimonas brevitalea]